MHPYTPVQPGTQPASNVTPAPILTGHPPAGGVPLPAGRTSCGLAVSRPSVPVGAMGDAYAQSRARAGEPVAQAMQEIPALTLRTVEWQDRHPPAPGQLDPRPADAKAASRKKKPGDEEPSQARPGCVNPHVWKAAKTAARTLDQRFEARTEHLKDQGVILNGALSAGKMGRDAGNRYLGAYPVTQATRLSAEGEGLLAVQVHSFLHANDCTARHLADALDLVRRMPSQERKGDWPVTQMVQALLPRVDELSTVHRTMLAEAIALLAQAPADGAAQAQLEELEFLAGLWPTQAFDRGVRDLVYRVLAGKGTAKDITPRLTSLFSTGHH